MSQANTSAQQRGSLSQQGPVPVIPVHHLKSLQQSLELGMKQFRSKQDIIQDTAASCNIDQFIVNLFWTKLQSQNEQFFKEYHTKMNVMDQIKEFNELVDIQLQIMKQQYNVNVQTVSSMEEMFQLHKQSKQKNTATTSNQNMQEAPANNTVPVDNFTFKHLLELIKQGKIAELHQIIMQYRIELTDAQQEEMDQYLQHHFALQKQQQLANGFTRIIVNPSTMFTQQFDNSSRASSTAASPSTGKIIIKMKNL